MKSCINGINFVRLATMITIKVEIQKCGVYISPVFSCPESHTSYM